MSNANGNTQGLPFPESSYKPIAFYNETMWIASHIALLMAAMPDIEAIATDLQLQAQDKEWFASTAQWFEAISEASTLLADGMPEVLERATSGSRETMMEEGPSAYAIYLMMRSDPASAGRALATIINIINDIESE